MIPCASGRRLSLTPSKPDVGSTALGASAPENPTLMRPLPLSMTTQGGSLLNGVGEGASIAARDAAFYYIIRGKTRYTHSVPRYKTHEPNDHT